MARIAADGYVYDKPLINFEDGPKPTPRVIVTTPRPVPTIKPTFLPPLTTPRAVTTQKPRVEVTTKFEGYAYPTPSQPLTLPPRPPPTTLRPAPTTQRPIITTPKIINIPVTTKVRLKPLSFL